MKVIKQGFLSNEIAEKSLIVQLLIDPSKMSLVVDLIPAEAFINDTYGQLYDCCVTLYRQNVNKFRICDYNDIAMLLSTKYGNKLSIDCMINNLIYESVELGFNAAINKVLETYVRRSMLRLSSGFQHALSMEPNIDNVIFNLKQGLDKSRRLLPQDKSNQIVLNDQMIAEQLDESLRIPNQYMPTGYFMLDEIIGGLSKGHISVLGARSSMGKTSFAVSLMLNLLKDNKRVLFFSLETSIRYILYRMCSIETGLHYQKLIFQRLSSAGRRKAVYALQTIKSFYATDQLGIYDNIHQINVMAQMIADFKNKYHLDVVVIDYLQLINNDNIKQPIFVQVGENMRIFKQLAQEHNVHIIILSQVNRTVDQQDSKVPTLNSLSYSSGIENAADLVLFMYREDYYAVKTIDYHMKNELSKTMLTISKNRNGPTGAIELLFHLDSGKFSTNLTNILDDDK